MSPDEPAAPGPDAREPGARGPNPPGPHTAGPNPPGPDPAEFDASEPDPVDPAARAAARSAPVGLAAGARSRAAWQALPLALLPLPLGGGAALLLVRAGHPAFGLGLLLGAGVGAVLALSWVLGTLVCFHRSLGALQSATLALWPVRAGGLVAALLYARARELDPGATFLGLLAAHVLGVVAEARATALLADAARAPADARS